jgi:hypothetical protein
VLQATAPLALFELLVNVCFNCHSGGERASQGAVCGVVPIYLLLVVRSTPAVFLLLLRKEGCSRFMHAIVQHHDDKIVRRRHFVALFVYQVVLENAPQMALGLYYTFAVAQTGVTRVGLLSIGTSVLSTLVAIIKVVTRV